MKRKKTNPPPIIKAKVTSSESWDSSNKFLTERSAHALHPFALGCAVSVHHNWGLHRTSDSSKEFSQEHPSKDTWYQEFYLKQNKKEIQEH